MAIKVPCCIDLEQVDCCDRLDFKYVLPHRVTVQEPGGPRVVTVEVIIHVRIERCPGRYALGDIAYTTTLLPGEKVRLFSTDRRSRFSFDQETKVSYRHAQASEDQFYMSSFARDMSDLTITEGGSAASHAWGDWSASSDSYYASIIFAGASGQSVEGQYDDHSTSSFIRSLHSHAESSHYRSEMATRTSYSVAVGEVSSRVHSQGESEDHFESASRVFSNPNHCHAVTYFFYRINREMTLKFSLVAIERRVRDSAAPTGVTSRPPLPPNGVSVMPTSVLGTASNRLEAEGRAQQSLNNKIAVAERGGASAGPASLLSSLLQSQPVATKAATEAIPVGIREQALKQVDQQLVKAGLLAANGQANAELVREISFERHFCLPTPGILVKGCLDECDVCEPTLQKEIELELERKKLENEMLKKKIDLLEKSQEYRCCPEGSEEETEG